MDFLHSFFESLIGGSINAGEAAGSGIAEGIARFFGSLFEGGAAEGAMGAAGRAAGVAGESAFARFVTGATSILDLAIDAQILKDLHKINKQSMASEQPQFVEHVRNGLKSHGFILQQLKAHEKETGVAAILTDYQALGLTLPDDGLLRRSYKKLFSLLHTDKAGDAKAALASSLGEAKNHLENASVRAAYNEALQNNKEGLEKLFEEVNKFNWKEAYESAENSARLRITGPATESLKGAQKWAAELNGAQKTGLVFGAVAAVAVMGFVTAHFVEKRRAAKRAKELAALAERGAEPETHVERAKHKQPQQERGMAAGLS